MFTFKKKNVIATITTKYGEQIVVYLPSGRSIVLGIENTSYQNDINTLYESLGNIIRTPRYLLYLLNTCTEVATKGDIWPELVANQDKIRDPEWVNAFLYKHYVNQVISNHLDDDLRTEPW